MDINMRKRNEPSDHSLQRPGRTSNRRLRRIELSHKTTIVSFASSSSLCITHTTPSTYRRPGKHVPYSSNSQSAPSAPSTPSAHRLPAPPSLTLSSGSPATFLFRLRESPCRRVSARGRSRRVRRRWGCLHGVKRGGPNCGGVCC